MSSAASSKALAPHLDRFGQLGRSIAAVQANAANNSNNSLNLHTDILAKGCAIIGDGAAAITISTSRLNPAINPTSSPSNNYYFNSCSGRFRGLKPPKDSYFFELSPLNLFKTAFKPRAKPAPSAQQNTAARMTPNAKAASAMR